MKAIGREGGEGWDKEEGKGEERREAHPSGFLQQPPPPSLNYLEISLLLMHDVVDLKHDV
jgi:hypothetical protein